MTRRTPRPPAEDDGGRVVRKRDGRWAAQLPLRLSGGRRKTITTYYLTEAEAEAGLAEMRRNREALQLLAERPLPFF